MAAKNQRLNRRKPVITGMNTQYKKQKIPRALREAVWIHYTGKLFERKCFTSWCHNRINAFDFQAGHNIPESKGGTLAIDNLVPICARCNLSMGNRYTFNEWCAEFREKEGPSKKSLWKRFFGLFRRVEVSPTNS